MASKIPCHSLELKLLYGLVSCLVGLEERPYPGRVRISVRCDSDNKNLIFVRSRILVDI